MANAMNLLSGQLFCSTAGTAQPGTDIAANPGFWIVALAGNTNTVYVGNNGAGALSSTSGFPLAAKDKVYLDKTIIQNLSELLLLSTTTTDGIAWLRG